METKNKDLLIQSVTATSYQIRTEQHQGKTHIVVPVVMMVEGVHEGSRGPLFHSAYELGKVVAAWNGIPITIQHPQVGDMFISANTPQEIDKCVGRIYNARMDGIKLKAEAWLDEQKLLATSPTALAYIRQQRPLEVSVGVFTDEEDETGEWNGETYIAIAHNHRPDHLALLPGGMGACNWEDGCGIRANTNQIKIKDYEMKQEELLKIYKDLSKKGFAVVPVVNETGYAELLDSVQNKLDSMDNEMTSFYLEEMYSDRLIYRRRNRDSNQSSLYQQYYTVEEGKFAFSGDPVEVRKDVSYKSISANGIIRTKFNNNLKTEIMEIQKKIDELIANTGSKFTDCDRTWLSALSLAQLEKLQPEIKTKTVEVPIDVNKALEFLKTSGTKDESYLSLLSKEAKEAYDNGLKLYNDTKQELIDNVLTNSKVWTKEELQTMEFEMLEKVSNSVKPTADYSGMAAGGGVQSNQQATDEPQGEFMPLMQSK